MVIQGRVNAGPSGPITALYLDVHNFQARCVGLGLVVIVEAGHRLAQTEHRHALHASISLIHLFTLLVCHCSTEGKIRFHEVTISQQEIRKVRRNGKG